MSELPQSGDLSQRRGFVGWLLGPAAPLLSVLLVVAIFYAIEPSKPPRLLDLRVVSVHTMIVGIAAMGMTFIIISGGIDLSVGSAIALTSVVAALMLRDGTPHIAALVGKLAFVPAAWVPGLSLAAAILAALLAGALCGLYNGLLITLLRLPPFIATLGTLLFFRGVAKWITDSRPVSAPTYGLERWVRPVPEPEVLLLAPGVWLTLVLTVIMLFVLRNTIFGRYTFAIGSNEATARLCGVRVGRMKVWIYTVAGALVGLAGLLQFARLTQGDPTVAIGLELDVIAAVVIGGGSLAGGQGSIVGSLCGAFLMAYLKNRCTVLGWSNAVQEIIVGHIIIVAVALDQWRVRRTRS